MKDHTLVLIALAYSCPICGAGVGVACITKSGRRAKNPHAYRSQQNKEN